ncbi:uncharacterized protein [Macaca fascicularis]|uniref:uncharacterized protein n=1 Tax=Macaca fascicularis TaxID=9541 RepID=UPI003D155207
MGRVLPQTAPLRGVCRPGETSPGPKNSVSPAEPAESDPRGAASEPHGLVAFLAEPRAKGIPAWAFGDRNIPGFRHLVVSAAQDSLPSSFMWPRCWTQGPHELTPSGGGFGYLGLCFLGLGDRSAPASTRDAEFACRGLRAKSRGWGSHFPGRVGAASRWRPVGPALHPDSDPGLPGSLGPESVARSRDAQHRPGPPVQRSCGGRKGLVEDQPRSAEVAAAS